MLRLNNIWLTAINYSVHALLPSLSSQHKRIVVKSKQYAYSIHCFLGLLLNMSFSSYLQTSTSFLLSHALKTVKALYYPSVFACDNLDSQIGRTISEEFTTAVNLTANPH
jgi:hypothetical protein